MNTFQKAIKYGAIALAVLLIISIVGGIATLISGISYFFDRRDPVAGEDRSYELSQDFQALDLEIGGAEVQIVTGDGFSLTTNHKYLNVKQSGGRLKITEQRKLGNANMKGVILTLTIPEGYTFDSVDISAGAGVLTAKQLMTKELQLELGAGEVTILDLTVTKEADIDGGAGKLTISGGSIRDLDLDMGVGQVNLTSRLGGSCNIDHGVGEANLTLLGSLDDYRITMDKGLGNASLNGAKMEDGKVYGQGNIRVEIDGGIGAIYVKTEA